MVCLAKKLGIQEREETAMNENRLEELTGANKSNYEQYLQRMTQSISQSSKGLIPFFAARCKRILDVGCGSGILINAIRAVNPEAKIVGIDINQTAVDTCIEQGLDVRNATLLDVEKNGEKYDCVIFSSVLHEFSSYDNENPYTMIPIEDAIKESAMVMEDGGIIIIRDGVRVEKEAKDEIVAINFKKAEDYHWISRFKKEFPDYKDSVEIDKRKRKRVLVYIYLG